MQTDKSRATLGVVIPTYNSARVVTQAIDSVLQQVPPPDRLVVVDDGSTDDTPSVLNQYHGLLDYVRQSNQGPSAARNTGWKLAGTDSVAFLDADDILLPGGLALRSALLEHRDVHWGYTDGFLQDISGNRQRFSNVYPPFSGHEGASILPELLCRNFISASGIIIRRDALISSGGFDESVRWMEDWDLMLRLAMRYSFRYCPEPTFSVRQGSNTLSSNRHMMIKMRYTTLVKVYNLYPKEILAAGLAARKSVADAHNGLGYELATEGLWREAQPYLLKSVRLWPCQRRAWRLLIQSTFSGSK